MCVCGGGVARRVNPTLTLSVQTLVNRPLSVPAERLLTEPWKHRGMDQLCCKPHTTADKGCTEGGDQLSFAQTGLRLQKKTFLETVSMVAWRKKVFSQYFNNILTIYVPIIHSAVS